MPASAEPRSIEKTGIARTIRKARRGERERPKGAAGWQRLHRVQFLLSSPASRRRLCPGSRSLSIPVPTLLSSAGSSVRAADIVSSTASEAASAGPWRKLTPIANSPSIATTTVAPAKSTARPAVSMATSTASLTSRPSRRPLRNLVTTKRA